jgi:hypothetical protein
LGEWLHANSLINPVVFLSLQIEKTLAEPDRTELLKAFVAGKQRNNRSNPLLISTLCVYNLYFRSISKPENSMILTVKNNFVDMIQSEYNQIEEFTVNPLAPTLLPSTASPVPPALDASKPQIVHPKWYIWFMKRFPAWHQEIIKHKPGALRETAAESFLQGSPLMKRLLKQIQLACFLYRFVNSGNKVTQQAEKEKESRKRGKDCKGTGQTDRRCMLTCLMIVAELGEDTVLSALDCAIFKSFLLSDESKDSVSDLKLLRDTSPSMSQNSIDTIRKKFFAFAQRTAPSGEKWHWGYPLVDTSSSSIESLRSHKTSKAKV